jgi:hypothetical protein
MINNQGSHKTMANSSSTAHSSLTVHLHEVRSENEQQGH